MVDDLIKAFGSRIDALTWMSPETKARAKEKLATLQVGVGYPDQWRDYGRSRSPRRRARQRAARGAVRVPAQLAKLGSRSTGPSGG